MLRTLVVAPLALLMLAPAVTLAGGRPVAETCINAGYRSGTAAFDMCLSRLSGDDPLAALEGGELNAHADKAGDNTPEADPLASVAPVRTATPTVMAVPSVPQREEIPASFNTSPGLAPPAPPAPAPTPPWAQGPTWPTPPTAPTLPIINAPNLPAWNFGAQ